MAAGPWPLKGRNQGPKTGGRRTEARYSYAELYQRGRANYNAKSGEVSIITPWGEGSGIRDDTSEDVGLEEDRLTRSEFDLRKFPFHLHMFTMIR